MGWAGSSELCQHGLDAADGSEEEESASVEGGGEGEEKVGGASRVGGEVTGDGGGGGRGRPKIAGLYRPLTHEELQQMK